MIRLCLPPSGSRDADTITDNLSLRFRHNVRTAIGHHLFYCAVKEYHGLRIEAVIGQVIRFSNYKCGNQLRMVLHVKFRYQTFIFHNVVLNQYRKYKQERQGR